MRAEPERCQMVAERTSEGDKLRIAAQTAAMKLKNGAKNMILAKLEVIPGFAFQPLLQIHHHKGHQDRHLGGDVQLAHDPRQAEAPFALPELALDRYPVKFVLTGLLFDFLLLFSPSRRPSKRRT